MRLHYWCKCWLASFSFIIEVCCLYLFDVCEHVTPVILLLPHTDIILPL